jgi:hypothetical protein
MSRATLGDLLAALTEIEDHHSRLEVATAMADVIGDILTANCVERAARGEVLVKCLRMTADQAGLCAVEEEATKDAERMAYIREFNADVAKAKAALP